MVKPSGRGEKVETLENNVLFGVFVGFFTWLVLLQISLA